MTEYPRCKTCKWWGSAAQSSGVMVGRTTRPVKFAYAPCGLLLGTYIEYGDAEAIRRQVRTTEDFGCVHHEPKP